VLHCHGSARLRTHAVGRERRIAGPWCSPRSIGAVYRHCPLLNSQDPQLKTSGRTHRQVLGHVQQDARRRLAQRRAVDEPPQHLLQLWHRRRDERVPELDLREQARFA